MKALAFVLALLCATIPAFAQTDRPSPEGFTLQPLRSVITAPRPIDDDLFTPIIFDMRGVVLQARASFRFGSQEVDVRDLKLRWADKADGFCVEYRATCAPVPFPKEDLIRLAFWIAGTHSTLAFTYLPGGDTGPFSDSLGRIGKNFVVPGYRAPILMSIPDLRDYLPGGALPDGTYVHPALNTQFLITTLAYIDYAPSRLMSKPFFGSQGIVRRLNNRSQAPAVQLDVPVLDETYTNADVHADFLLDLSTGALSGLPLRYHWTRMFGYSLPYMRDVEVYLNNIAILDPGLATTHENAIRLYRTAAVLRAFQLGNPDALLEFYNSGLTAPK